ncbi:unnamed protein product, partial [Durusdinium trenchii]
SSSAAASSGAAEEEPDPLLARLAALEALSGPGVAGPSPVAAAAPVESRQSDRSIPTDSTGAEASPAQDASESSGSRGSGRQSGAGRVHTEMVSMECAKDYNVELPTASDIELANTNCQNRRYPNLQFPLAWGWCKFQKRHKDKEAWIFCEQCKVWVAVCHWDGDWRHWLSNEPNAFGACEHFQASEREKMSSLLLQRSQQ